MMRGLFSNGKRTFGIVTSIITFQLAMGWISRFHASGAMQIGRMTFESDRGNIILAQTRTWESLEEFGEPTTTVITRYRSILYYDLVFPLAAFSAWLLIANRRISRATFRTASTRSNDTPS